MIPARKFRKASKVIDMTIHTLLNMTEHCFNKQENIRPLGANYDKTPMTSSVSQISRAFSYS